MVWSPRFSWILLDGCRPPAALRLLAGSLNQNPICLYFLFSAGSPCGCSFDGQVVRLCVSARALVCEGMRSSSEFVHTHFCRQTTPGMRPFFTLQLQWWMTGFRTTTFLLLRPPRPALLSSARLCRATDTHSVDSETEEGGSERGAPHTRQNTEKTDGFLCPDPIGRNTPSQFSNSGFSPSKLRSSDSWTFLTSLLWLFSSP